MSGLLVITEERLWGFVRDAYEEGRRVEREESPMPEDRMREVWLETGARKRVLIWVQSQKERSPA